MTPYQEPISIQRLALENGAELEVLDASRPMAGDRWQVAVLFRVTIPVTEEILAPALNPSEIPEMRRLLGDRIVFQKRLERTFIDNALKDPTLSEMIRRYLEGARAYLSKPAFVRNYVRKQYQEAVKKQGRQQSELARLPAES